MPFVFCRILGDGTFGKMAKIKFDHLPKSMRATITDWPGEDHFTVRRLIESSTPRTLRLLKDVDELEREVLNYGPPHGARGASLRVRGNSGGLDDDLSHEESQRTLDFARRAHRDAHLGRQYRFDWDDLARRFHNICEEKVPYIALYHWKSYKGDCRHRHTWGQFFRSHLDWDWDLAGSLKRMYKLPRKREGLHMGSSGSTCHLDANACQSAQPTASLANGRLEAVVNMSEEPVEEVRVAYRSPNGELLYRTFRVVGTENPGLDSSG